MSADGWKAIENHHEIPLVRLFEEEPDRLERLAHDVSGIYFDWSKTHLDAGLVDAFEKLAEKAGLQAARDALFAGEIVNPTEKRAAEHVAERGQGAPDAVALAGVRRKRMRALVDAIEAGAFGDVSGILHIGIGGSVLGPALLVDALGATRARLDVSFLSNIDGAGIRAGGRAARPGDDAGRGRLQDLHHGRDPVEPVGGAGLASRQRGRRC